MVVLTLLAACGSGYTKRDFIARADAICASALRQARAIPPPTLTGSVASQAGQLSIYLDKLLPIVQSEFTQLQAVRLPAQGARGRVTLERWFKALREDLGTFQVLAAAAKRGDAQGVTSAEAALRASQAGSLAQSYGLPACATPSATVT
jgi:hypothetical protein